MHFKGEESRPFLQTFGAPSLQPVAGHSAPALRRKDLALLVYLRLAQGRSHSRSVLASLLWGDTPEGKARHSLTQAYHRLRRALGEECLDAAADRIEWRGDLPCDAALLECMAAGGDIEANLLEIYCGDFLGDFRPGPGAEAFEDWADAKRSTYRVMALDLLDRLGREAESAGSWDRVIALAQRGIEIDPYWESAHRRLMGAWDALGHRVRALQHYEQLVALIEAELGTGVDPDTRSLAEEIRSRSEPRAKPAAPVILAPPLAGEPPAAGDSDSESAPAGSPHPSGGAASAASASAPPLTAPRVPLAEPRSAGTRPSSQVGALVIAGVFAGLLLVWYGWGSRGGVSPREAALASSAGLVDPRAAELPPPCVPGTATGQLVDEVFHFGIQVKPQTAFAKAWTLQNTGSCTWGPNFRLHFDSSSTERLSTTMMDQPLMRSVPPGDTVTFRLQMRAPSKPGTYDEYWELRDSGDSLVRVGSSTILAARIVIPEAHAPTCGPGKSSATLLVKKFMDGLYRQPRERFRYGWTIKNSGACAWPTDTSFRFVSDTQGRLSQLDLVRPTRSVLPGETYTFLVPVHAPAAAGVYREDWELRDGSGVPISIDGVATAHVQFRIAEPNTPHAQVPTCKPGQAKVRFVDENWLDHTQTSPGQTITKRWTIFNVGDCSWAPGFSLRYTSSTSEKLSLSQDDILLGETVPPWTTYTIEMPLRMPARPGVYREDWRFTDDQGNHILISLSPYLIAVFDVIKPK